MFNKKLWQVLILIFWLTNNRTRIKIKSGIRIWVRIRTFRIGHTVNSLFKRVVFEMTYPLVQAQLLPAPVVEGWLRPCQGYHQHWREPTVQLRGRQGYAVLAALFLGWSQSGSKGALPVSAYTIYVPVHDEKLFYLYLYLPYRGKLFYLLIKLPANFYRNYFNL